jgi:2-dehydro-3-deoxygluconokinase
MKRVVTFGEIMLRLSPEGFLRFSQANSFEVVYGGGESNVAVSLANYGVPVDFVTRLPKNDIGVWARTRSSMAATDWGSIFWRLGQ